MYLPTDRTIRIVETSPGRHPLVLRAAFLFKRDVIPGRENTFEVTSTRRASTSGAAPSSAARSTPP
jgi:heme/copper-type cytochrome/quinol oxidase subunit 2